MADADLGEADGRAEALEEIARAPLRDFLAERGALPPGLPSLPQALHYLHRPPRGAQLEELAAGLHPAQQRLAFEELLAHHLALKLRKRALQSDPAPVLSDPGWSRPAYPKVL